MIVKASRLKAVLEKARNAGHAEEAVCIAGVNLVIRSLEPDAYNAIMEHLEDVSEIAYPMSYQVEHVCRAIVQVDESDFRDVKYIEVEGESGVPAVKVERHQWLRDNLVSTWSREMVTVAFRKVMDAIKGAETRAYEGVQFRVSDETDEEKYRRILGELKETGTELPAELRDAILKEEGLSTAMSKEEIDTLDARSRTWSQQASEDAVAPDAPDAREAEVLASAHEEPKAPIQAPQQLVNAARVPLNQTPIQDPVPAGTSEQGAAVTANQRKPAPPPDQVHTLSRSARVAALEEDLFVLEATSTAASEPVESIIERPPTVGVNPRYVNPHNNASRSGGLNPRGR